MAIIWKLRIDLLASGLALPFAGGIDLIVMIGLLRFHAGIARSRSRLIGIGFDDAITRETLGYDTPIATIPVAWNTGSRVILRILDEPVIIRISKTIVFGTLPIYGIAAWVQFAHLDLVIDAYMMRIPDSKQANAIID